MFHPDGRAAKYDSSSNKENFGWWWNSREIAVSSRPHCEENHRSSKSSMLSCVDSDDSDSYAFVQNLSRRRESESDICEKFELSTFARNDPDVDLIERDARETMSTVLTSGSSKTTNRNERNNVRKETNTEDDYTSERLIRSQGYQILPPSSHYLVLSQVKFMPEDERLWKFWSYQKWLSHLIDSKQIDSYAVSSSVLTSQRRVTQDSVTSIESNKIPLSHRRCLCTPIRSTRRTETISSGRSSNDRFNSTWDNCKRTVICQRSPGNTVDIQSYDPSSDAHNDTRENWSMCLYDELATASRDHANDKDITVNEVASIIEGFEKDPEKATVLLEEDRFCNCASSHDQLTRLALTIETDMEEESAVLDDSDNWIRRLRDKIERLQLANKEIHRDICRLRTNFQCDEGRISDLSNCTTKLRQDIDETRYFDDLLKLLQGELEMISKRNWPFILGHNKPRGEVNLII